MKGSPPPLTHDCQNGGSALAFHHSAFDDSADCHLMQPKISGYFRHLVVSLTMRLDNRPAALEGNQRQLSAKSFIPRLPPG